MNDDELKREAERITDELINGTGNGTPRGLMSPPEKRQPLDTLAELMSLEQQIRDAARIGNVGQLRTLRARVKVLMGEMDGKRSKPNTKARADKRARRKREKSSRKANRR